VLGALRGLAEVAGGRHEIVPFAPASPAGARLIRLELAGLELEPDLIELPFAHAWRTAWSRLARPAAERILGRFDVLHFSDWMYPPQARGVRATTIHDLVPLRFPQWTTRRTRAMHGRKYANAAKTCDVLFANSGFTAGEVIDVLGVEPRRLRVARPGVDRRYRRDGERADLGRPYLLTVATLEPRKNLATLVAAFRLLGTQHALAVAGGEGWGEQPELRTEGVRRLGFVGDDELARLYRGADVFVFPSRFEGFGIPVIEAMASGTPCVVSSHPSLDEACGDAAVRVDPENAEGIAAGVERALRERDELVEHGLAHAAQFSWLATGRALLEGYLAAS
jgi:glycosyltransferase involved in cell wall biosynthesis